MSKVRKNKSPSQISKEYKLKKYMDIKKMDIEDMMQFAVDSSPTDEFKVDRLKVFDLWNRIRWLMKHDNISPDIRIADCGNILQGRPYGNLEVIFTSDDDPNVYGIDISVRGRLSDYEVGVEQ